MRKYAVTGNDGFMRLAGLPLQIRYRLHIAEVGTDRMRQPANAWFCKFGLPSAYGIAAMLPFCVVSVRLRPSMKDSMFGLHSNKILPLQSCGGRAISRSPDPTARGAVEECEDRLRIQARAAAALGCDAPEDPAECPRGAASAGASRWRRISCSTVVTAGRERRLGRQRDTRAARHRVVEIGVVIAQDVGRRGAWRRIDLSRPCEHPPCRSTLARLATSVSSSICRT